MTIDRIKLCAIAAAVATTLTGEAFAQTTGSTGSGMTGGSAISSPAPAGMRALSGSAAVDQAGVATTTPAGAQALTPSAQPNVQTPRTRTDPTGVQSSTPAATQPSAAKGLSAGANSAAPATSNNAITGGVPAIGGVTPNRAELASSAFTKLDASSRGYLTTDDVRQLGGFESAFRAADQNGDGRLNASEFNAAWGAYTGNVR